MTREQYESLSAAELKQLAKTRGLKNTSALKKAQIVERMLEADAAETEKTKETKEPRETKEIKEGKEARQPETEQSRGAERREHKNARTTVVRSGNMQRSGMNPRGGMQRNNERMQREGCRPRPQQSGERPQRAESAVREETQRYEAPVHAASAPAPASTVLPAKEETAPAQAQEASCGQDDRPSADLSSLDSGTTITGYLEVMPEGFGFIRSDGFFSTDNDVYVSPSQIRRFSLRTGDILEGNTRIRTMQEKFSALLYVKSVNGMAPGAAARRVRFEDMTPVFPDERLRMERDQKNIAMRVVDLICPIGKGQRGMIVSQPKAGKTTLLKDIARSLLRNNPEIELKILLIDERPEEVTDIREAIVGDNVEVVASTFDEQPDHHRRVSEMAVERAKRLVEQKKDVVILLDSITRLARAYNLLVQPSGRTLSGGLDPAALYMPKRFFGAARNMREGGSLTILATALVETGSKMDDVVYEEFKGTGNMELVLDRKLSERRIFPAIDIPRSSTRREDLLLTPEEQEAAYIMRKALNSMKSDEAVENILNLMVRTRDNREFVQQVRRQRFV